VTAKFPNPARVSPAIVAYRRRELERWIEQAIALLDTMDGDADLEDDALDHDDGEWDKPGRIVGGSCL
jgi:hypothetical protein